jgi:capsular polysaccharide export protein
VGPLGSFFSRFAQYLGNQSVDVYKISFPLYEFGFSKRQRIFFDGVIQVEFAEFLRRTILQRKIKHVFMYGDFIDPHQIAIGVCAAMRADGILVDTWVFELGYLRPNYVTLEANQVNCRSNLNQSASFYRGLPAVTNIPQVRYKPGLRLRKIWKAPTFVLHAFTRYAICSTPHKLQPKPEYLAAQARGFVRKFIYSYSEKFIRKSLFSGAPFFLVILQVSTDSQLQLGSPFDSVESFILEVISSFARHADPGKKLFIKHHPRDNGYTNYGKLISDLCREYALEGRIMYFHDSPLAPILRDTACCGCVMINSSVGFQVLFHGTPLKALGKACYNIEGLADQQPLSNFWLEPKVCDRDLFLRFYSHVLEKTQVNGNFDSYFPFHEIFPIINSQELHQQGLGRNSQVQLSFKSFTMPVTRLFAFLQYYCFYGYHWFLRIVGNDKNADHQLESAACQLLKALGVSVQLDGQNHIRSDRREIHIANHVSPIDMLLVQGIFRLPSITTAHLHRIDWLFPGFASAASRYGHILLDYRSMRSRFRAVQSSQKVLLDRNRLFTFPSGSIQTPIEERFSKTIAFLAKQNDAVVIPWKIMYPSLEGSVKKNNFYKPIRIVLEKIFGPETLIVCSQGNPFDSRDYTSAGEMTAAMHSYYIALSLNAVSETPLERGIGGQPVPLPSREQVGSPTKE